jgi:AcrR family transcriptional regulator
MARPRAFDADQALDRAMQVFWNKGFEGASLPDLTHAMKINRPSLYAAFGNKEELFFKAIERYQNGPTNTMRIALAEPTARKVFETLLDGVIVMLNSKKNPGGCMIVQSALSGGEECAVVKKKLAEFRRAGTLALRKRFEQALADGDLPAKTDPAALAAFTSTIVYGLSVQASSGMNEEEMQKVKETALKAWPV